MQMHACRTWRHNKDERHSSLEKYTSHFIWKGSKGLLKVLLWEGVGDRTELQHIDPHFYGHNSVSFLFSWAAQPGARGPSLSGTCSSFQHLLSNCNCSIGGLRAPSDGCWFSLPHLISNWLNFLFTELYNCSTPTFFLWASQIALNSTHPRSRLYPDIPRPDAPVIYIGAFAGVNMQHSLKHASPYTSHILL